MPYKDYSQNRLQARRYYAEHREEQIARKRATREANREAINAGKRASYAANREKIHEKDRAYRALNSAKVLAWGRANYHKRKDTDKAKETAKAWRLANKERLKATGKAYRAANKERIKANQKLHRKRNRDLYNFIRQRRRAQKAASPVNNFAIAQWREIKAVYGFRCVYCERKIKSQALTQDHIIPLSKGGPHTASNIVPSCHLCNSLKQAGPPPKPVQPVLLTLAPPRSA